MPREAETTAPRRPLQDCWPRAVLGGADNSPAQGQQYFWGWGWGVCRTLGSGPARPPFSSPLPGIWMLRLWLCFLHSTCIQLQVRSNQINSLILESLMCDSSKGSPVLTETLSLGTKGHQGPKFNSLMLRSMRS